MFGLCSKKKVKRYLALLKEKYKQVLDEHKKALVSLREENADLRAKLSVLESEREDVKKSALYVETAKKNAVWEGEKALEEKKREAELLTEKLRSALTDLSQKYPDDKDIKRYEVFVATLEDERDKTQKGFNMDDVLSPKQPLDLEKLCRELGLMEEEL